MINQRQRLFRAEAQGRGENLKSLKAIFGRGYTRMNPDKA
jgi:hypothetical protein